MLSQRVSKNRLAIALLVAIGIAATALTDVSGWRIAVGLLACYLLFRLGVAMLAPLAIPVPDPPPAGELRKVRINYRCTLCGMEVRMTVANDEMPAAPRHCLEDMELVAPVME